MEVISTVQLVLKGWPQQSMIIIALNEVIVIIKDERTELARSYHSPVALWTYELGIKLKSSQLSSNEARNFTGDKRNRLYNHGIQADESHLICHERLGTAENNHGRTYLSMNRTSHIPKIAHYRKVSSGCTILQLTPPARRSRIWINTKTHSCLNSGFYRPCDRRR